MRKFLIAGNWKMHGSKSQAQLLLNGLKESSRAYQNISILVCPPFVFLNQAHELLKNTAIQLGAQNLYVGKEGAYTGEVSGSMLSEIGCQYVLVGHSERRTLFHESFDLVAQKCQAALAAKLTPILCVGESKVERERGETEQVVREQIDSVVQFLGIDAFRQLVIAYEPVWAIGTGLTATPLQAQEVHAYIREFISKINVDIAQTICILYGGSMKAENAASLLAMPDIDGGLIGGASLDANSFLAICKAASQEMAAAKTTVSR